MNSEDHWRNEVSIKTPKIYGLILGKCYQCKLKPMAYKPLGNKHKSIQYSMLMSTLIR